MNRQQYKDEQSKTRQLEFAFRDACDDPKNPKSRFLAQQLREMEDDFQLTKNPRTIEARVKRLEQEFKDLDDSPVMSNTESNTFERIMRDLIARLRKFDNY